MPRRVARSNSRLQHQGKAWDAESGCISDGQEFQAFVPIWDLRYSPFEDDPSKYGNCYVETFSDEHCSEQNALAALQYVSIAYMRRGEDHANTRKVNDKETLGGCWSAYPATNLDQRARSFLISCM